MSTYMNFEQRMKALGPGVKVSEHDLALAKLNPNAGIELLNAKDDWNKATDEAGKIAANQKAENIRKQYGYTAGTAGAEYKPTTATSFAIDGLYDDLVGETAKKYAENSFSYNPERDPLYHTYKKAYAREGAKATEDVLGKASAMTGGIPSSYAVTAAGQTANNYAAESANIIPTLENMAYGRYQDEQQKLLNLIGLYQGERAYDQSQKDAALQDAINQATIAGDTSLLEDIYGPFTDEQRKEILLNLNDATYQRGLAAAAADRETREYNWSEALKMATITGDTSGIEKYFGGTFTDEEKKNILNKINGTDEKLLNNAILAADLGSYDLIEGILGIKVPDRIKNPKAETAELTRAQQADIALNVGDWNTLEALGFDVPEGYKEAVENSYTAQPYDMAKLQEELAAKYGGDMLIPSNEVEAHASDPYWWPMAAALGYKKSLTEADIASLEESYGTDDNGNVILDAKVWNAMIQDGYSAADMNEAGVYLAGTQEK